MNIAAVILARGGSKEIPKKNIIQINNTPLLEYSIKTALHSEVNQVWVSTDCPDIKKVAKKSGANVLDRPQKLSQDYSKSEDALLHFAQNVNFDILVFIQPTSPLLSSKDINKGLQMIRNKKYDSVFSAYKEHWLPRWNKDYKPVNWDIDKRPMRQEVEDLYVENGAFYITTYNSLINSKLRYSGKIGILEMPFSRSFQIDTRDDLSIVERML